MGGGGPSRAPRSWQGAGKDSWATAPMALVQSPRKEEEEGEERLGGGRQGGSAAQFVAKFFFFFLFPPFSYVKSAQKLGSLFVMVSSVSWGWGGRGGDPRPGTPACI